MPFGALKRAFGGKTSVEFVNIGPHVDGDEGEQRAPRAQSRGRSGNYQAEPSPESGSDDEGAKHAMQPPPSSLPEPMDQDGQAPGTRRCRFSQSETGSVTSSQRESLETGQATNASTSGPMSDVEVRSGTSGRLSTVSGAPRKNSILDNRMQQLRNLRLELASIRDIAPQQSRWQTFKGKASGVMNCSFKLRWSVFRRCGRRLASKDFITTPFANSMCSGIILLNALFIGLEMELNDDTGFKVEWFLVESGFLAFFIIELALRFRAGTCRANMKDPWIIFDMTMILPGVFDTWVLQFLYASTHGMPRLTLLRLVRLARVARVLRVIRLIRYFHELILLARGILGAVQALSWSLVLIFLILYVSAVITTSWFNYMTRVDSNILNTSTGDRFKEWFGSIGASLLTLFQLMTLEGWPEILRTSMQVWPQAWLFFVPFILLTNVSLLNAITAVVVEKVFSIAQNEAADASKRAEKERLNALKKLKQLFLNIDVDHNATLDLEEFRKAMKDPRVVNILHELKIATYEADELFECLDLDGNQELSVAEFVDGCLRAVGPAQSKHLLQVQYDLLRNFKSLRSKIGDLHVAVRVVLKLLSRVHGVSAPRRKKTIEKTEKTKDTRASQAKEEEAHKDVDRKTSEGTKKEDDESSSLAASKGVRKEASGNKDDARLPSKDSERTKLEVVHTRSSEAPPRRKKRAASSSATSAARYSSSKSSAGGPVARYAPSSSSASSSRMLERPPAAVVDTRDYKPIGGLLESTTQDQQAISQVLQTLLEEMRDVHGHVSEVMALDWDSNRDKSRHTLPPFFMRSHTAGTVSTCEKASVPSS